MDFAPQHHRQLWAAIGELEEDNLGAGRLEVINRGTDPGLDLADLDLPRLLGERLLLEQSALLGRLTPLLEPSEVQRLSLAQPLLQLRGATASLERQRVLRRCRHLLDAWSSQRLQKLEECIARLLEEERQVPPPASAPPGGRQRPRHGDPHPRAFRCAQRRRPAFPGGLLRRASLPEPAR